METEAPPAGPTLSLPSGDLPLPAYLPDATYGYVRALGADDLERAGIDAVVMNVFHLMQTRRSDEPPRRTPPWWRNARRCLGSARP